MNFFQNKDKENFFLIQTKLSPETIDHMLADIEKMLPPESLDRAIIGNAEGIKIDKNYRWLKTGRLPLSFWAALILKSALLEANDRFFHFDLNGWTDELHYLRYEAGEHYKAWHKDTFPPLQDGGDIRKLTVLMSLSDPSEYEGGDFCFYDGPSWGKVKFQKGDIAVFPACLMHRVTPVKSGVRKMLIGWHGGPPFK